jgi:uncharacterized protein YgbK (DUF1537 family)
MRIGVVADDFTGASDIANTLARAGARTTLHLGVPVTLDGAADDDAAVVALKSRSIPAAEAVALSLDAARAVATGLDLGPLVIGPEIATGVPAMRSRREPPLALALKSGNFGGPDFFGRATAALAEAHP